MKIEPTDIATVIKRTIKNCWQGEITYRERSSGKLIGAHIYTKTPDELADKIFERIFVRLMEQSVEASGEE